MTAEIPGEACTLCVAILFGAIFLFGGRLAYRPGQSGRRRFLSFAAGISVGYAFVHVLPALGHLRDFSRHTPAGFERLFPEHSVYLWTMVGFLFFYGLETMVTLPHKRHETHGGEHARAAPWRSWLHVGGFAAYAWLLTYLMVWTGSSMLALSLYAVAMGMHLFPIACTLSEHYQAFYKRRGAWLLAIASMAGWFCGQALEIPKPVLMNLVAVVAGGVILNTAIAELPKEKEGRFWSFLTGATVYTALLLILAHYEKHPTNHQP